MAAQNRDELQTQIDSTFVATLQIADHKSYLKDPQAESLVFRKDVIASQSPAGGLITIDYSNKDLATVTTTGNLAVSFTGLENGDVKYLRIQKNAGNTVSFIGATDVSPRRAYINTTVTVVYYRIINKNNTIFVCAESVDFDWQPDLDALKVYIESTVNGGLITKVVEIGVWDMDLVGSISITLASLGITKANIRDMNAIIISNTGDLYTFKGKFITSASGMISVLGTNIFLFRVENGLFDTTAFNGTASNRGHLKIDYVP